MQNTTLVFSKLPKLALLPSSNGNKLEITAYQMNLSTNADFQALTELKLMSPVADLGGGAPGAPPMVQKFRKIWQNRMLAPP